MPLLPTLSPFHTCTALLFAAAAAAAAHAQTAPPVAPIRNVTDTYFGVAVTDPYRYLEDLGDPAVAAWFGGQADYARSVLDRIPGRTAILRDIERYGDTTAARVSRVTLVGASVYYLKRGGTENWPKLYVRKGLKGSERLLFDPEAVPALDGKHYAIDYFAPSPDNRHVAYGISPAGSEDSVLHVLDVDSGKSLPDTIDRARHASPSWLPDGRFLYLRLQSLPPDAPSTDKQKNQRTYVHRLGDDPDKDVALFGAGVSPAVEIAPTESGRAFHVPGSTHVVALAINGVAREFRVWSAPLAALDGGNTRWTKVAGTADAIVGLAVTGDTLYARTYKGASRFKIVRTSLATPDIARAEVVVPESAAVITAMAAARDALYVGRMDGGVSDLLRLEFSAGATPKAVPLPFDGDVDSLVTDARVPGVIFDARTWIRSGSYYAFDPATGRTTDTALQPQGKYDNPGDLVSREVRVPAADGVLVPLSIIHKKGLPLDGTNPAILYGYGAYGIAQTPAYAATYLAWFERGGILAVAHVRGGGEFGDDWHKAGQKLNKPNTWRDAIACAEWLSANKYTGPSKLAIMGGSAGGIFVGRAITERPDLFAAAINRVPRTDALRAEFSPNGVVNVPEFGTVTNEQDFKGLLAMSPYHHVTDGARYPAMLLTTGWNDTRVFPWHPGKLAARLQAAGAGDRPVLLRVDYDRGHGAGASRAQRQEESADIFAFLLWQFGVPQYQP